MNEGICSRLVSASISDRAKSSRDDLAETTVVDGLETGAEGVAPRLARGTNVGRYVIIDVVGSGGMGVVYSAFDPELDRKVALKLLRPEARANVGSLRARDRLLREAQAMARLSHPNVLPVFDVGTYESAVFVALEFIDGETLRAWLDRVRPQWPEILGVMTAAGRGLAAAHAEGLVHRDFKPENVLLGRRGDVRVMDFGLARNTMDSESAESTHTDGVAVAVSDGDNLTKTGFVLGTPAYMAPEQHRGAAIDPRADQFAFCVALYEAVYRERPFAGRLASEIMAEALAQAVRPPPQGARVPRWLRRVILRGLAPQPEERWPDMATLLAELGRDRRGRTGIAVLLASTAAVAVAAGVAFGRNADPTSPCAVHSSDLDDVWSLERRAAIAAHFSDSGLPYAAETWTRAAAALDTYTNGWIAARIDACEATRVRREQSESTMERRGFCLDRRKAQLDGLLGVFAAADAAVVERAIASTGSLEPFATCESADELGGSVPAPSPEVVVEVERLRGELARLRSLRSTARFDEALALASATRDAAVALGYAPLVAEARMSVGFATADLGQPEPGAAEIVTAIDLAEAQGMDTLVAHGEAELVTIVGELGLTDQAERWAAACVAKLGRLGGNDRILARLSVARATVLDEAGRYAEARQHALAALELWTRLDPNSPERAMALGNLGRVAFRAQDFTTALADFEGARDAAIAAYGPRHPEVAKLLSNIATALHALGEFDRSGAALEQSLALFEAVLPADHPDIAITLTNLSAFAYRTGKYERAIEISARVIEMRRRVLGPRSPKIAASLNNQAISLLALGRLDEALERYREALSLYDENFPEGHPDAAMMLTGIGEVLLRKGEADASITPLERAFALAGQGVNPYAAAESQFLLARALWEAPVARDRKRARMLALQSEATLRAAPEHERKHLEGIETWLREHSL